MVLVTWLVLVVLCASGVAVGAVVRRPALAVSFAVLLCVLLEPLPALLVLVLARLGAL